MASALEKIQKKLQTLESGKKSFFTADPGETRLRVMPSWLGKNGLFYREVVTHYALGPDRLRVGQCCLKKCPACKRVAKLARSSDKKKQRRAERMMAQTRIAMNVVDLKNPKKILIWTISENLLQELLAYYVDSDYGDFTHPKRGYNIILFRKGKKKATRYKIRLEKNPSRYKKWKRVKDSIPDLDKRFAPLKPKRLLRIMQGTDERDD